MGYPKFILFGDSITQHANEIQGNFALQPALQDWYIRKLDILNRGYSGYNSEHARVILPHILDAELNAEKNNVKLITIFFGTNDGFVDNNPIQPISLERYRENIDYLVSLAIENNIKPIVIGPSLHDPKICKKVLPHLKPGGEDATSNKRYYQYSEAAREVCKNRKVAFVDLWDEFRKDGGWTRDQLFQVNGSLENWEVGSLGHLLSDGVHFTGHAYKIMYDAIKKAIGKHYPEFLPDNLATNLAVWSDINPTDLKNSIFK
ncbi:IAH1 [Candida oxycetoniae]|uniref:IAH1 n=1 Tax=Candida oxycetoniae TaxID=497107 RepID=A0AAI9T1Q8_9ASCO|nr:IAH1 [Candida oxycetoniae]KAI3407002.1 IAH1 [Candida oxycetoniae]